MLPIPHKLLNFKAYLQNNLEGRFRYASDLGSFFISSLGCSFENPLAFPIWNSILPYHKILRLMILMQAIVTCCERGVRWFDKVKEIFERLLFLSKCVALIRTSIGSGRPNHLGMEFKPNIQPPAHIVNKRPYLMFYSSKLSVSKTRRKITF